MSIKNQYTYCYYAAISGACASTGSTFGKLAGISFTQNQLFSYILQATLLGLMIVANTANLTFYMKALHHSVSSVNPTVINASTNYLLSGLIGVVVFGEVTTLLWWTGIGLILSGLVMIIGEGKPEEHVKKTE